MHQKQPPPMVASSAGAGTGGEARRVGRQDVAGRMPPVTTSTGGYLHRACCGHQWQSSAPVRPDVLGAGISALAGAEGRPAAAPLEAAATPEEGPAAAPDDSDATDCSTCS